MKVEIPKNCPICSHTLQRVKMQLFCINDSCEGRAINRISNFCKKFKIKGLSVKSIEKLEIQSIPELYSLSEDYLVSVLGKNGGKIYKEIQDSLNTDINSLIGSLGIRLIGITTAANKLKGNNLRDIDYSELPDKAYKNFEEFLESELYYELCKIPFIFNSVKGISDNIEVCLTGKFSKTKNIIKKELENLGYIVKDNVTKKTKIVITSDINSSSGKILKAREYNIEIKTLEEILK